MKIKNIHIVGFGKFNDFSMEFKEGLQIIYGPNEYGKSTIMEFIKMMFYSKRAGEKTTSKNRFLREKYTPWSGGSMGGKIVFEYDGNEYEIQKRLSSSSPSKDDVIFQNISTGKNIILGKGQEIGEYLFGIDIRSFERSSFMANIGKSDFEIYKKEEDKTAEKIIANFSENSNFTVSKRLLEAIKDLESSTKRSGKIPKLKYEIDELKIKIHNLKEKEDRQHKIQESIKKLNKLKDEKSEIEKFLSAVKSAKYLSDIESLILEKKDYESLKSKINFLEDFSENYINNLKLKIKNIDNLCNQFTMLIRSKPKNYKNFQKEYGNIKILSSKIDDARVEIDKLNNLEKFDYLNKNLCDSDNLNDLVDSYPDLKSCVTQGKLSNVLLILYSLDIFFSVALCIVFMVLGKDNFMFYLLLSLGVLSGIVSLSVYIKKHKKINSLKKLVNLNKKSLQENLKKQQIKIEKILNKFEVNSIVDFYGEVQSIRKIDEKCDDIKNQIITSIRDLMKDVSKIKIVNSYKQCKFLIEDLEKTYKKILMLEEKIKIKANVLDINDCSLANLNLIKNKMKPKINFQELNKLEIDHKISRLKNLNNLDLEEKILNLQKSIRVFDDDSNELKIQLEDKENKLTQMTNYLKSLEIAYSTIENISDNLRKNFSPKLNQRVSEIFSSIIKNKYEEIRVQKDYTILINNEGFITEYNKFSSGTIDQAYFSLRIAISEMVSENSKNIPLLLDDIFMQYDETRLANLLKFLKEYSETSKRQIILFTCHKSIKELALRNSIIDF
ncbi:MAG: ATP-binding protein [Acutalibacteraceae bacterium]